MINVQSYLEMLSIPSFGVPECPGVYFIYLFNTNKHTEKLIYIGSSHNMRKRIFSNGHIYRRLVSHIKYPIMPVTKIIECSNFELVEKNMIRLFKPTLNKQWCNNE